MSETTAVPATPPVLSGIPIIDADTHVTETHDQTSSS